MAEKYHTIVEGAVQTDQPLLLWITYSYFHNLLLS